MSINLDNKYKAIVSVPYVVSAGNWKLLFLFSDDSIHNSKLLHVSTYTDTY